MADLVEPTLGDSILFEVHIIETDTTYRRIGKYIEKFYNPISKGFQWYNIESYLEEDDGYVWNVYPSNIIKNFGSITKEKLEKEYPEWLI